MLAAGAADVVDVLRTPAGLTAPVRAVGVYDAGETVTARDQLLIAVGVDTSVAAAAEVLQSTAHAGACAVVMRRGAHGPTPRLLSVAAEVSTVLLTRLPWIEWTELIGLLRAGLAHGSAPTGAEPSINVPLDDLPGLANAFATLVGGAITVEAPDSQVLAFSRNGADPLRRLTILGQRVPAWRLAELAESGSFRALWTTPDVVHRPADDRFPERLAIAVRAGDEVLGSLWAAADGTAPLPGGARDALREAARTAVPYLLHHRLHTTTRRSQAAWALLEGPQDVPAATAALGLSPETPCAVLTVTVRGPGTTTAPTRTRSVPTETGTPAPSGECDRALHLAALQATTDRPSGFALRDGERLEVLLPLPPGSGSDTVPTGIGTSSGNSNSDGTAGTGASGAPRGRTGPALRSRPGPRRRTERTSGPWRAGSERSSPRRYAEPVPSRW